MCYHSVVKDTAQGIYFYRLLYKPFVPPAVCICSLRSAGAVAALNTGFSYNNISNVRGVFLLEYLFNIFCKTILFKKQSCGGSVLLLKLTSHMFGFIFYFNKHIYLIWHIARTLFKWILYVFGNAYLLSYYVHMKMLKFYSDFRFFLYKLDC